MPVCRWNQLDLVIVLLSIMGITLEKIEEASLPINPTIIRIMRVLRIARGTNAFRKVPQKSATEPFVRPARQIAAGAGVHQMAQGDARQSGGSERSAGAKTEGGKID